MQFNLNSGVSTYVTDLAQYMGRKIQISHSGETLQFDVNYCGDFAAYYLGSNGGWNSFLFEGLCKRTDEVERHSIEQAFNNTTIQFGEKPYVSEVTPSYELSTGWLSDREAERFAKDLLQTNALYIHNLADDEIFPAVITDTSSQYKKFIDERKLVSYTLNIKASQTQIRR